MSKNIFIVLLIAGSLALFLFQKPIDKQPLLENPDTQYTTVIKLLNSIDEVNAEYERVWKLQKNPIINFEKGDRYGFSYMSSDVCFVVIAKEDRFVLKEFERTLGHEHLHCMYGAWHD